MIIGLPGLKTILVTVLGMLVASGCATRSTIPSRIRERPEAYSALTPTMRAAVDAGQIMEGMSKDAVFMAWGHPSETVQVDGPGGPYEMWVYVGTGWRQREFPTYYYYPNPSRPFPNLAPSVPLYETVHTAYRYAKAEVTFCQGVVQKWSVRPAPGI
jgi:hypothetical protein